MPKLAKYLSNIIIKPYLKLNITHVLPKLAGIEYFQIMIKAFGARNFYSFKEGLEVDFSLNDKVPPEDRERGNINHVMGIKGGNGSGKTNILKAILFIGDFIRNGWNLDINADIPYRPHFDSDEVSSFYIVMELEGAEYDYSFELKGNKVISEELKVTKLGEKEQLAFTRSGDEIISLTEQMREFETINLISNASLISLLPKYKFSNEMPELKTILVTASRIFGNAVEGEYKDVSFDPFLASEKYRKSPEAFSLLKSALKIADSSIKDINIHENIKSNGDVEYYPTFTHESQGDDFELGIGLESSGTRAIYNRMILYWATLSGGGVLIYDEFDIHLHSLILPNILDLFTNKKTNPNNAQLIFTAHNTEILEKLGRYRAVLVEKEDNESYCYRLDELKGSALRNGRPISPLYLKGKLGGVPKNA